MGWARWEASPSCLFIWKKHCVSLVLKWRSRYLCKGIWDSTIVFLQCVTLHFIRFVEGCVVRTRPFFFGVGEKVGDLLARKEGNGYLCSDRIFFGHN